MGARLCGDRFIMCTHVESLCCTPEKNVILYVNYTSIKNPIANIIVNIELVEEIPLD